jgi:hypothetical protein
MRSKPAVFAFIASFAVYLIPLIGPHALFFVGETFFRGMSRTERLWMAADMAAALAMQSLAFAVFYLVFKKRNLASLFLLGTCIAGFLVAAQFIFMLWIPSAFLIEEDKVSDTGTWPVVCSAEDAWLSPVVMPYRSPGESVREVLIQTSKGGYGIMSVQSCAVATVPLPQPTLQPGGRVDFMLGVDYFVPGKSLLFNTLETQTGIQTWSVAPRSNAESVSVETPANTGKILSSDGEWVGWIERIPDVPPPVLERIVIRHVAGSKPETRIALSDLGPASYVLTNIDMSAAEVALSRNNEFMFLGLDGEVHSRVSAPADVAAQSNTFRMFGEGWVGWDAYRDQGPYRVAWSLPAGKGSHHVLKGRSIDSVAVSPSGDLIGVSVSTALNIGDIQDAVYVLRASDGKEVFRRYLPRYTRTQVLFPEKDLFMYSADGKTLLLRVQ